MMIAGIVVLALVALIIGLLMLYARRIPKRIQRFLGRLLLFVSAVETILIIWILIFVWNSGWPLWELSFNDFWQEELMLIYFIKEWMYTWLWNDLLNLIFVFLPAVVFLALRTVFTTVIGIWFLKLSQ